MKHTDPQNVQEIACCLSKNIQLLKKLLTGPKQKTELADLLGVSKSTVYYRFKNLEEIHLVERGSDGYQLTTTGRNITETHLGAMDKIDRLYAAQGILQGISTKAAPPRDAVVEAETVNSDGQPEQLWTTFGEWILDAEVARGLLPRVTCGFIDHIHETVFTDGMSVQLALSPEVAEYLTEYCAEAYQSVRNAESTAILETSVLPQYVLMLMDEPQKEVGLLTLTEQGYANGFMRFDTEQSWRWADDQYAEYTGE